MATPRIGDHAVVIGASVAGLLAARVLADSYRRVTIVERDELPAIGEGRKAVPQGRHLHALLASGKRCLDELFPGFGDELLAAGTVPCSALGESRFVFNGHELAREPLGYDNLLASRPLIEGHIRQRVLALPNVAVVERTDTLDLVAAPDRERVVGVQVRRRGEEKAIERLDAELVVAASGRAGRVPAWLDALGYPRPVEERLPIDLRYASRRLRLRRGALGDDKMVLIGPRPGLPRGVAVFAQEGGEWMITASGYGHQHRPPTDERGYLEFIATVAPPDVVAAIRHAEPLGGIVTHGFAANRRRRYERLKRFPDGLLVIGDAICSFNPLYGQGMSVAALEAIELHRCLKRGEHGLARRFFRTAGKVVDPAWELAIGGDLALPEVAGDRPLQVRLGNAYMERLLRVAEHDPVVARAFSYVGDLLEPPSHVMRPRVMWRVLHGGRRRAAVPAAGPSAGSIHREAIVRAMTGRALAVEQGAEVKGREAEIEARPDPASSSD